MKNILIFNDISGLGNCSLSANLPIFSKLGHYCMPIVTACFSCQTGFENYSLTQNPNTADFAERICAHAVPNALYVGFCNDVSVLNGVKRVVSGVLPNDCYLFVDPIMGDNGKLYPVFDDAYAGAIKSLVATADCISPNLTEACILGNIDYFALTSHKDEASYIDRCKKEFKDFLKASGAKNAVITGVAQGDKIYNLVMDGTAVDVVASERVNVDFSGTGDVFSSVLLGELLNGKALLSSARIAADFVAQAAAATERSDKRFGVDFCKILHTLQ